MGQGREVLDFFESLNFRLPPRKAVADFLQECTSRVDQKVPPRQCHPDPASVMTAELHAPGI